MQGTTPGVAGNPYGYVFAHMTQKLTQIKGYLAAYGLNPKHRYGQHFLHDEHHMARIVEAASLREGDVVLEVGPGTGSLSTKLLDAGARLVAVEIDRRLEPILENVLSPYRGRVKLIFDDVLASKHRINPVVWSSLSVSCQGEAADGFKLIANLPYNVASPLMVNLLVDPQQPWMTGGVVMVQHEVACRLLAGPGTKDYGPLTVMTQAVSTMQHVSTVPATCFWPRPAVESTVVRFQRRTEPLTKDLAALQATVHRLFTQRRKQLGAILGRHHAWPVGVDPAARPDRLTVEQVIALSLLEGIAKPVSDEIAR